MRGDIERFEVAVGEMWLSDLNSLDMISDLLLLRDRAPEITIENGCFIVEVVHLDPDLFFLDNKKSDFFDEGADLQSISIFWELFSSLEAPLVKELSDFLFGQ